MSLRLLFRGLLMKDDIDVFVYGVDFSPVTHMFRYDFKDILSQNLTKLLKV